MEKNVGKTDKIIRYILGAVSIYLGYVYSFWFYILAVILIGTAAMGFCGLYKPFGIDTSKMKAKR